MKSNEETEGGKVLKVPTVTERENLFPRIQ